MTWSSWHIQKNAVQSVGLLDIFLDSSPLFIWRSVQLMCWNSLSYYRTSICAYVLCFCANNSPLCYVSPVTRPLCTGFPFCFFSLFCLSLIKYFSSPQRYQFKVSQPVFAHAGVGYLRWPPDCSETTWSQFKDLLAGFWPLEALWSSFLMKRPFVYLSFSIRFNLTQLRNLLCTTFNKGNSKCLMEN